MYVVKFWHDVEKFPTMHFMYKSVLEGKVYDWISIFWILTSKKNEANLALFQYKTITMDVP